jgi:hypothetical protein
MAGVGSCVEIGYGIEINSAQNKDLFFRLNIAIRHKKRIHSSC